MSLSINAFHQKILLCPKRSPKLNLFFFDENVPLLAKLHDFSTPQKNILPKPKADKYQP